MTIAKPSPTAPSNNQCARVIPSLLKREERKSSADLLRRRSRRVQKNEGMEQQRLSGMGPCPYAASTGTPHVAFCHIERMSSVADLPSAMKQN